MPRASSVLDDQTPLTGPRIDVPARIGWLMRTTRVSTGLTLREMAAALREHDVNLSPASVSRVENEGRRSDAALRGYALVAGLKEYQLAVTVDDLCQSFSYAPPRPPAEPLTLVEYDAACEAVACGRPTADDWWRFAMAQREGTGFGMPSRQLAQHAHAVATQMQRTSGYPRFARWAALCRLNAERYSEAVNATVLPLIHEPHGQRPDDLLGVVSEHPSAGSLGLLADLLSDSSSTLSRLASYGLQSILVRGGAPLERWRQTVPSLRAAWAAAGEDRERLEVMTTLTGALPPELQTDLCNVARPVEVSHPTPADWSRSKRNRHYSFAADAARSITAQRGLADDPMLARLLFEAFFEPRGVRKSVATWLLSMSVFADDLAAHLPRLWDRGPGPGSRAAVARVGAFCQVEGEAPDVSPLLGSPDEQEFQHALTYHAHSGTPLPQAALDRGLAGDEVAVRRTLFCLGMAGDPRLGALSADADQPEAIREGARWWLARGPRIVD